MSNLLGIYRQAHKRRCACGETTFLIARRGKHIGAWCHSCGRWLKWLNVRERGALALPGDLPEHGDERGQQ